jgi:hypothetical protein
MCSKMLFIHILSFWITSFGLKIVFDGQNPLGITLPCSKQKNENKLSTDTHYLEVIFEQYIYTLSHENNLMMFPWSK